MNEKKVKDTVENIRLSDDAKERIINKCVNRAEAMDKKEFTDNVYTVERVQPRRFTRIAAGVAACAVIAGGAGAAFAMLPKGGSPANSHIASQVVSYGSDGVETFGLTPSKDGVEDFMKLLSEDHLDDEESLLKDNFYNVTPKEITDKYNFTVFKSEKERVSCLLYNGRRYSLGMCFGGLGIGSFAVADIDGNGTKELYYTTSFGSGMWHNMVNCFDFGTLNESDIIGYADTMSELKLVEEKGRLAVYSASAEGDISSVGTQLKAENKMGDISYYLNNIRVTVFDRIRTAPITDVYSSFGDNEYEMNEVYVGGKVCASVQSAEEFGQVDSLVKNASSQLTPLSAAPDIDDKTEFTVIHSRSADLRISKNYLCLSILTDNGSIGSGSDNIGCYWYKIAEGSTLAEKVTALMIKEVNDSENPPAISDIPVLRISFGATFFNGTTDNVLVLNEAVREKIRSTVSEKCSFKPCDISELVDSDMSYIVTDAGKRPSGVLKLPLDAMTYTISGNGETLTLTNNGYALYIGKAGQKFCYSYTSDIKNVPEYLAGLEADTDADQTTTDGQEYDILRDIILIGDCKAEVDSEQFDIDNTCRSAIYAMLSGTAKLIETTAESDPNVTWDLKNSDHFGFIRGNEELWIGSSGVAVYLINNVPSKFFILSSSYEENGYNEIKANVLEFVKGNYSCNS